MKLEIRSGMGGMAMIVAIVVACPGFTKAQDNTAFPLGRIDFDVSCTEEAQQTFNHAVALLHHMTYPKAKTVFEEVSRLDATCAMSYWGVAMSLFQPLWPTRPGPEERRQGWAAVERAEALGAPTERERLFIAAVDSFFRDPESDDYWARIRRWANASETAYLQFPEDEETAAFYALALLATAPAGGGSLENQNRAAELLQMIHANNPLHPGSFHYLIHANDARGREHESLDLVRQYDDIAPNNPHALHMPTHIYTRLGEWDGVIDGNVRAADAALQAPAGDHGEYVWDEFPHAVEYLVYAYLQQGADSAAAAQIERLKSTDHLQPTFKTAFHLSSVPVRYALERHAWAEAAELTPRPSDELRWDRFPWPEAVSWFGRGLGAARLNRIEEARQARGRLQELEDTANQSGEELFTRQIRILRFAVSAWIAQAEGQEEDARRAMVEAAKLEASTPKHPVTPAPTLPAQELLGDLLLVQARPEEALAAYSLSLELRPHRFNSLLGAARAARALDDMQSARRYYAALLELSDEQSTRTGLVEARDALERWDRQK